MFYIMYLMSSLLKKYSKLIQNAQGMGLLLEYGVDEIHEIVGEMMKILRDGEPYDRVYTLHLLLRCIQTPQFLFVQLVEVYLLPFIKNVAQFCRFGTDFQALSSYFRKQGRKGDNIENLSYNYVHLACQIIQLGAAIKPYDVYEKKEYGISKFRLCHQQMKNNRWNIKNQGYSAESIERMREIMIKSIQQEKNYEDYYLREVELEIRNLRKGDLDIRFMLKNGDTQITSQVIARISYLISNHQEFLVRKRAMLLLHQFILWGDIEALLVINYGGNVEEVVKRVSEIRGFGGIQYGKDIYSEIEGQFAQKQEFYLSFLQCLQMWGVCYSTTAYFDVAQAQESPICSLYRWLRFKKYFIFPKNDDLSNFQRESHRNFAEKKQRNKLLMADILGEVSQSKTFVMNMQMLVQLFEQNDQRFRSLKDGKFEEIDKLFEFANHFQSYISMIDNKENWSDKQIDEFIERALDLIELIQKTRDDYSILVENKITFEEFKINLKSRYQLLKSQLNFSKDYQLKRQKLKIELKNNRKNDGIFKNQLKTFNTQFMREMQSKYRQRVSKMTQKNSSQDYSSSINLQIFTMTKMSFGESQVENAPQDNKRSNNLLKETRLKQQQHKMVFFDADKVKNEVKSTEADSLDEKGDEIEKELKRQKAKNKKKANGIYLVSSEKEKRTEIDIISTCLNSQYYQYLNNADYRDFMEKQQKFIYSSDILKIKRVIKVHEECVFIHFLIQGTIIDYQLQQEQCMIIELLGDKKKQNQIILCGKIKKIPLKLPSIQFILTSDTSFNYLLPFSMIYFCRSFDIGDYNSSKMNLKSEKFRYKDIYPDALSKHFFLCKLMQKNELYQSYLWRMEFLEIKWVINFHFMKQRYAEISLYEPKQENFTTAKYFLNYLVHLLKHS